jgi:hypothetical protein
MKRSTLPASLTSATLSLPALADFPSMPPVKEGLWKIHDVDTYSDQPTQDANYFLCRSHAYDESVREKMKTIQAHCVTSGATTLGNKRSINTTCDIGGYHPVSKAVLTMSDNFYHSETGSTITVSGHISSDKTVQDQTYVGVCPAGMSPGARKLADGTIEKHH